MGSWSVQYGKTFSCGATSSQRKEYCHRQLKRDSFLSNIFKETQHINFLIFLWKCGIYMDKISLQPVLYWFVPWLNIYPEE
jgi:hypothetical protein